jgi:hypothetical protein
MSKFSPRAGSLAAVVVVALSVSPVSAALAHGGEMRADTHAATKAMTVKVSTRPAPGGVLVRLRTTGYRWAPERLSPSHGAGNVTQGEGHGHIYVDGAAKPALLVVGPWTYLPLKAGKHTLRVTLNANDHDEWTWNGKTVQGTTKVTVPATAS